MNKFVRNVKKKLRFTSRKGEYNASKYEREIDKRFKKLKSISIQSLNEAVVFGDIDCMTGNNASNYYLEPVGYTRHSLSNDVVTGKPQIICKHKLQPPPTAESDVDEIEFDGSYHTSDDNLSFRSCLPSSDVENYYQYEALLMTPENLDLFHPNIPATATGYTSANEQTELKEKKKKYSINQEISKYNQNLNNLIHDMKNYDDDEICEEFYYSESELHQSRNGNDAAHEEDFDEELYHYIEHLGEPEERDFENEEEISHKLLNYLDICEKRPNNREENIYEDLEWYEKPQTAGSKRNSTQNFEELATKTNQNKSLTGYSDDSICYETNVNQTKRQSKQVTETGSHGESESVNKSKQPAEYLNQNVKSELLLQNDSFNQITKKWMQLTQTESSKLDNEETKSTSETGKINQHIEDLNSMQEAENVKENRAKQVDSCAVNQNIKESKQFVVKQNVNELKQKFQPGNNNSSHQNIYEFKQMPQIEIDNLKGNINESKQMPLTDNFRLYRNLDEFEEFKQMPQTEIDSLKQNTAESKQMPLADSFRLDRKLNEFKQMPQTENDNLKGNVDESEQMPLTENFRLYRNLDEFEEFKQMPQTEIDSLKQNINESQQMPLVDSFRLDRNLDEFKQRPQTETVSSDENINNLKQMPYTNRFSLAQDVDNLKQVSEDDNDSLHYQYIDDLKQMPEDDRFSLKQMSQVQNASLNNQKPQVENISLHQNMNEFEQIQVESDSLNNQSIVEFKQQSHIENITLHHDLKDLKQIPENDRFSLYENIDQFKQMPQDDNFCFKETEKKSKQLPQIEENCDLTEEGEYAETEINNEENDSREPEEDFYVNIDTIQSRKLPQNKAQSDRHYIHSEKTNDELNFDDSKNETINLNFPIPKPAKTASDFTEACEDHHKNIPKTQTNATRLSLSTKHRLKTENNKPKSPVAAPRYFQTKVDNEMEDETEYVNVYKNAKESLEELKAIKKTVSQVRSKINEGDFNKTELLSVLMKQMRTMNEVDGLELDSELLCMQEEVLYDIQGCISELTAKE